MGIILKCNNIKEEDIKGTLGIINHFIFAKSLDDKEMEAIFKNIFKEHPKDEKQQTTLPKIIEKKKEIVIDFKNPNFNFEDRYFFIDVVETKEGQKEVVNKDKLARFLVEKNNLIATIPANNFDPSSEILTSIPEFWIFSKTHYSLIPLATIDNFIDDLIYKAGEDYEFEHSKQLIYYVRDAVKSYIRRKKKKQFNADLIAFKNGVYNIKELAKGNYNKIDFSPDNFVSLYIDRELYENEENIKNELNIVRDYLLTLFSNKEDELKMVTQFLGNCLMPSNEPEKTLYLVGNGGNGKSLFLRILAEVFSKENVAFLKLTEIGHRFRSVALEKAKINIADDTPTSLKENDSATLKNIVSGNPFMIESKGKEPKILDRTIHNIFSGNGLPNLFQSGKEYSRRLLICELKQEFKKNGEKFIPPHELTKTLTNQKTLDAFLYIFIKSLQELCKNNWKYEESEDSTNLLKEFEEQDTTTFFINSTKIEEFRFCPFAQLFFENFSQLYKDFDDCEFSEYIKMVDEEKTITKYIQNFLSKGNTTISTYENYKKFIEQPVAQRNFTTKIKSTFPKLEIKKENRKLEIIVESSDGTKKIYLKKEEWRSLYCYQISPTMIADLITDLSIKANCLLDLKQNYFYITSSGIKEKIKENLETLKDQIQKIENDKNKKEIPIEKLEIPFDMDTPF